MEKTLYEASVDLRDWIIAENIDIPERFWSPFERGIERMEEEEKQARG
jgi:hypothetical protein